MALTTCYECRKEVSQSAPVCPHCGAVKPWQRQADPRLRAAFIGIVAFGLMATLVFAMRDTRSPAERAATATQDSTTNAITTARYAAAGACKRAAEPGLKSPSTAQWGDLLDAYTKEMKSGRTLVQVTVDAQNSFGGMMRTTIECQVEHTAGFYKVRKIRSWQR